MATETLISHLAALPESRGWLYERVALRIGELIEHGTLRPGERIPSVRQLSRQEQLSIATVTQAYRVLENRGLIEARPQSGYYVRPRIWSQPPEPAKSQPSPSATRVSVNDLVMEVLQANHDPTLIVFGAARPGTELLPTVQLNRTLASVARRYPRESNTSDVPPGHLKLRTQIARRAMESGCTLAPDEIVVTCGCQEALNLCLRAVAKAGDTIAIESPTYYGILQIIESLGMKACEVPTFPRHGVCLDELEKRLTRCKIKACVFSPNFSNPLGSCMPDEKKQRLVELLARRGIPLIEDDNGNLPHSGDRPKAAKAFDRQGMVLLCDSFTKTLAPGLRVGWTAPGRFQTRVEHLKFISTVGTGTLPQMAIAEFLANGGYDHHLRKLRRALADQVRCATQAIAKYFPDGTKVTRPTGGHVLWVELPPRINSLELFRRALAEKISITPGPIFSPKQKYQNFIRLSCGDPWTEALDQALRRLGEIMREMG
ncbi:MAG: PLP-dependent aminotransferase family protein [Verrucomicrobia bacterium]|nr:PLP-dependent aminotransferase family protein [Verrucomicrobiota bacterium]